MTTDAASIARNLSEAQRIAILSSPKHDRVNLNTRPATLAALERLGITEGNTSLYYTPLGIEVCVFVNGDRPHD